MTHGKHINHSIKSYDQAKRVLDTARSRSAGKPLQNNTRLVPTTLNGIDGIGVLLHNTIVVNYTPGGLIVLNTGGWYSMTTRDRIETYSPARISTDFIYKVENVSGTYYATGAKRDSYKTWTVSSHLITTTPAKPAKCRTCKGNGSVNYTAYLGQCEGCDDPAYTNRNHSVYGNRTLECYRCKSTGVADYGSHAVYPEFLDGVTVDADGEVIGRTEGTPRFYREANTLRSHGVSRNTIEAANRYVQRTEAQELHALTDPRNASTAPASAQTMTFDTGNPEQDAEVARELQAWNELLTGGSKK